MECFLGDVTDRAVVGAALDGVTVVYHLAGKLLRAGEPPDEYRRTHVGGTAVLLDCSRRRSSLERFVHVSTTGVLGRSGATGLDETAPFRPTNVYEETKAEAEMAVRSVGQGDLRYVIVRPGLVYGPGDLHLLTFFRSVLRGLFRPIGRRPVWLHPIYIDDMTDALILCGVSSAAVGECFHIAGPRPVALEMLAASIAEAGGRKPARGRIPLPVARGLAEVVDMMPAGVRASAPLTRSRLDFLTHSRVYSVRKAEDLLDFVAPTLLRAGIGRTVDWYRTNGYLISGALT